MKKQKTYSFQQVWKESIAYFTGDELAASTWMNKYCMKDHQGNYVEKTPDDMHRRMAKQFSGVEAVYRRKKRSKAVLKTLSAYGRERDALDEKKIYGLFKGFRYIIPQGSVMAALGNPYMIASLSNCVVLPELFDSYGGILYTDQQLAQLFKRRCGVGIDISGLRPAGLPVLNAAGSTSGAVSFMERYSNTTREVAQNGRRGALMITMDISHPEIEDFIRIKQDLAKVTGANISVRISDAFMKAAQQGRNFSLCWPLDSRKPTVKKNIAAGALWNDIVQCAHRTAEPGIIFWDRQHQYSTSSVYPQYKNVSTNPCSEIAMQGGDSCRLIALNLFSFVENPFSYHAAFNYKKFYETAYEAQRLMDDLVDLELKAIERILAKIKKDPEPDYIKDTEIRTWKVLYENGKNARRTGLGFTALADTIAALGMKFDSDPALEEIEKIMRCKCEAEFNCSVDMAIERGTFKGFSSRVEKKSAFVNMLATEFPDVYRRMMRYGRRNVSISTVAPTGSLSILAQCSSGIEPVFMLSYKRRKKINPEDESARVDFTDASGDSWQEYPIYHHKLKTWMEITGEKDIQKSPYAGSTAAEINWLKRVGIQASVQKYVTHSISSTINLPADVSVGKVSEIYQEAWKRGLKGITVYREGARSGVLVSGKEQPAEGIVETTAPRRPAILEAEVVRFMNGSEKWIAVVGLLNKRPYEIFTGKEDDSFSLPGWVEKGRVIKNKAADERKGYDFEYTGKDGNPILVESLSRSFNKEFWNYAKLISGVLRHGMPLVQVVELVENLNLYSDTINTWKSGVERALKKFIPDGTKVADKECPSCKDPQGLVYEEGCLCCKSCGHSQCM